MPSLTLWLWFGLTLAALLIIQRGLLNRIYRLFFFISRNDSLASLMYSLLFFPGIALHEISHWLAAHLLGVSIHAFSLLPRRNEEGKIELGYVETEVTGWFRAALIGAAPLLAGIGAIWLMSHNILAIDDLAKAMLLADWKRASAGLRILMLTPDIIVWIYLIFSISNTMLPSARDRSAWLPAGLVLCTIAIGLHFLGYLSNAVTWALPLVETGIQTIVGCFVVAAMLDLLFFLPVLIAEWMLNEPIFHYPRSAQGRE